MTLIDYISDTRTAFRQEGMKRGVKYAKKELVKGIYRRLDSLGYRAGQNVYEREWDLLILLDACRIDLLDSALATHDYPYLKTRSTHVSPGSMSEEWMERTFTKEYANEMARTAYITANPFSQSVLNSDDFALLDEVWRDHWEEPGTVLPRSVTDQAIIACRKRNFNRVILHYMQPHYPFRSHVFADGWTRERAPPNHENVWHLLEQGEIDKSEVWNAYYDNLLYVLDDLTVLLNNIDANTAIVSSDHGNLVGEFGLYGHPRNVPANCLRVVPWCQVSAEDLGTHMPDIYERESISESVADRLRDLGYGELP